MTRVYDEKNTLIMTPGPVDFHPRVYEAMSRVEYHHRTPEGGKGQAEEGDACHDEHNIRSTRIAGWLHLTNCGDGEAGEASMAPSRPMVAGGCIGCRGIDPHPPMSQYTGGLA